MDEIVDKRIFEQEVESKTQVSVFRCIKIREHQLTNFCGRNKIEDRASVRHAGLFVCRDLKTGRRHRANLNTVRYNKR